MQYGLVTILEMHWIFHGRLYFWATRPKKFQREKIMKKTLKEFCFVDFSFRRNFKQLLMCFLEKYPSILLP